MTGPLLSAPPQAWTPAELRAYLEIFGGRTRCAATLLALRDAALTAGGRAQGLEEALGRAERERDAARLEAQAARAEVARLRAATPQGRAKR